MVRLRRLAVFPALLATAAAMVPVSADTPGKPGPAQAVIALRVAATFNGKAWIGGHFENFDHVSLPPSHVAGDKLTVYDGPAWESERVGFRIYLDQRNAIDLFGKKQPAPVLQWIGRGVGDYHKEADWGMDILHVTDSLGAGGIGVIEQGHVRQVGTAQGGVAARVIANGPGVAGVQVDNRGLTADAKAFDLSAQYRIAAGSRCTQVSAHAPVRTPIVAGIEKGPGVAVLRSPARGINGWGYVATYGDQSFINDGLGIAILYRVADVAEVGDDGRTVYIRFKHPGRIRYEIAAAWAKEGDGLRDRTQFEAAIDRTGTVSTSPICGMGRAANR